MAANPPDPHRDAVTNASDFLGVLLGLATGALVFSVGLINDPSRLPDSARSSLLTAWLFFVLATGLGLLSRSRVVRLIDVSKHSVYDFGFIAPAFLSVVCFLIATGALALTLRRMVDATPATGHYNIKSAIDAVRTARGRLSRDQRAALTGTAMVELVKGVDPSLPTHETWHVKFTFRARRPAPNPTAPTMDLFYDAKTGTLIRVP
jgi:hypothetical protein